MKDLHSLYNALSPIEVNWIRHIFNFRQIKGKSNKRQELFELIVSNGNLDNVSACKKLYNSKPNSAFSHLKKRLKEDILKYAAMAPKHENIRLQDTSPELLCQEKLTKLMWAMDKGLEKESMQLIMVAHEIAEAHNLPSVKKYLYNIIEKHPLVWKLKHIIPSNRKACLECGDSTGLPAKNNVFNDKLLCIESSLSSHKYKDALQQAISLETDTAAKSEVGDSKFAETKMLIAKISLCLSDVYLAEKYALSAKKSLPSSKLLSLRELLFFCYFRKHDNEELNILFRPQKDYDDAGESVKWVLYKSYFLHSKGQFKESLKLLQNTKGVWGDKSGVTIGYKLLEMMNLISINDLDWFELKLDSFRKLVKRFKEPEFQRFSTIAQLLKKYALHNYDLDALKEKEHKTILLLSENSNPENAWNPLGPEVIPMEEWLFNRNKFQMKNSMKSSVKGSKQLA